MSSPKTRIALAVVMVAGSLALSGCATKKYVNEQIASVSQRIDGIDTRLTAVEGTANNALAAGQAAAGQAQQNGQRIDALSGRVDSIEQRLAAQQRKPRG